MVSLYRTTVPVFLRGLGTLEAYLGRAAEFERVSGAQTNELLTAKLAPDLFGLAEQIQLATKTAVMCSQELSMERDVPNQTLTEGVSHEDLLARLHAAAAFLRTLGEDQFPRSPIFRVKLAAGDFSQEFSAEDYVFQFALPNFYFHVATSHAILRAKGLKIGKSDYLGSF